MLSSPVRLRNECPQRHSGQCQTWVVAVSKGIDKGSCELPSIVRCPGYLPGISLIQGVFVAVDAPASWRQLAGVRMTHRPPGRPCRWGMRTGVNGTVPTYQRDVEPEPANSCAEYPMPSKVRSSLLWILEPLEDDETYFRKRMFGCDAAYVDGLLCLVVADRDEPWNGLLVCTSQERHAALIREIPALRPHQVLGKWLCVKQSDPAFEDVARHVTSLVLSRDSRIGVESKPRRRASKLR